jgi:hypothetical protein
MPYRTICSPSALRAEFEDVRRKVSLPETEESSFNIEQGIARLTRSCNIGCSKFSTQMLAGIRSISQPLNIAMSSERSSLSRSAIELVTALSTSMGPSFGPLISLFLPTLLKICAGKSKESSGQAKACILTLIEKTPLPSLLPYLAESGDYKSASSASLLVAAEGILSCLNSKSFNIPNVRIDTRALLFEDVVILTASAQDASTRVAGRAIFEACKASFPDRVARFVSVVSTS